MSPMKFYELTAHITHAQIQAFGVGVEGVHDYIMVHIHSTQNSGSQWGVRSENMSDVNTAPCGRTTADSPC